MSDDLVSFLTAIPGAAYAAVAAIASSGLTWWLGIRTLRSTAQQARLKMIEEMAASEQADRNQFRHTLMDDLGQMRALQKECELDRIHLRGMINANEKQISVLKASAEIMQRWLDFFRKAETTNPGTLTALLSALPIGPIDPEWKP